MNRREALRAVLGAGMVVPAVVVGQKLAAMGNTVGTAVNCQSNVIPCDGPEWVPPPPDARTPEQIVADNNEASARDFIQFAQSEYPGKSRFGYVQSAAVWYLVSDKVRSENIPHERRMVGGYDAIIVNGCVALMERPHVVHIYGHAKETA